MKKTSRDKKLALLWHLGQEFEPISLSDLVDRLEEKHSLRTIRRWLTQLIEEGVVKKIGTTKGVKYLVIKSSNQSTGDESSCFRSESLPALKKVRSSVFIQYHGAQKLRR